MLRRGETTSGLLKGCGASEKPLPQDLAKRLKRIPHDVFLCRDVESEWAERLADDPGARGSQAFQEHLTTCPPCRALLAALGGARVDPAPLPAQLRARLQKIPLRRRPIPWWLGDIRFALAASYLLACCVTFGASAAGKAPNERGRSSKALLRSVAAVGGGVNGSAHQALAASERFSSKLQRVAEEWFSFSQEKASDAMIPADQPRPSKKERR